MVVGTGARSSAAGYNVLEGDITQAIGDDQADFGSAVSHGAGALTRSSRCVIVASLLMALVLRVGPVATAGGVPLSAGGLINEYERAA